MLDWIIIGAGIHGCTTAAHLAHADPLLIRDKRLLLIDTGSEPLSAWNTMTERVGMKYLRSPGVHHLHPDPRDLLSFAKRNNYDSSHLFGTSKKPSVSLFRHHCTKVLEETGLLSCFQQARALSVKPYQNYWRVDTSLGTLNAKNIVLAMGTKEHCALPSWLPAKGQGDACHIHQKQEPALVRPPATVIGGGMSGVQKALDLSRRFPGQVTLALRHPLRVWEYDSAPEWMGGKYRQVCRDTSTFSGRRHAITSARRPGSITKTLYRQVQRQRGLGRLIVRQDPIRRVTTRQSSWVLHGSDTTWEARAILCATGDQYHPAQSPLVTRLIDSCQLPLTPCGYPALGPYTPVWAKGLYVSGPLADLAIGPTARNISGARTAAICIQQEAKHVFT